MKIKITDIGNLMTIIFCHCKSHIGQHLRWHCRLLPLIPMADDMIGDMEANENLSPLVTELFLKGKKLIISLVFISQSYFKVPKTITLNLALYFIMEILNKK